MVITPQEMEFVEMKMKDAEFAKALEACQTVDEYKTFFAEQGIQITEEDIQKALDCIAAGDFENQVEVNDEIPEKALEQVTGGSLLFAVGLTYVACSFMIGYNMKDYKRLYNKYIKRK